MGDCWIGLSQAKDSGLILSARVGKHTDELIEELVTRRGRGALSRGQGEKSLCRSPAIWFQAPGFIHGKDRLICAEIACNEVQDVLVSSPYLQVWGSPPAPCPLPPASC